MVVVITGTERTVISYININSLPPVSGRVLGARYIVLSGSVDESGRHWGLKTLTHGGYRGAEGLAVWTAVTVVGTPEIMV